MAKGPFLCTVISGHVLTSGGGKVRRQQVRKARPHEQGRNITKPENKTARDLYRLGELSSLQSAGDGQDLQGDSFLSALVVSPMLPTTCAKNWYGVPTIFVDKKC